MNIPIGMNFLLSEHVFFILRLLHFYAFMAKKHFNSFS